MIEAFRTGRRRMTVALLFSTLLPGAPALGAQETVEERPPLRLRPGDMVMVNVSQEPQLSGEHTVDPDGRVLVPLVGVVTVAGRDFGEVAREIREGFARELADRPVQVVPRFRMAILGEVRSPGLFPVDASFSLADALAAAGGLSPSASSDGIVVTRGGVAVLRVAEENVFATDLPFRPGDGIVVERQGWIRRNLGVFVGTISSLTVAVITGLLVR